MVWCHGWVLRAQFSLISGLWQYWFSRPEVHVLIIGLDNAGKTVRIAR
jgi:hypothetical protein